MSKEHIIKEEDFGIEVEKKETIKQVESYERFSSKQRAFYLSLVALTGMMAPMASTIFFPALIQIKNDFNTTDTLIDVTVSVFIFIVALTPLVWGGSSDLYGRRWVYIISQSIFVLSCVGCALSNTVDVFIVMRVFQGIGSSAPLVVGIGTISDIYPRNQRGTALGLFFIGPLIGPVIGPIIGGFMAQYLGWRSIFWLMTILSALILIIISIFLKETLPEERRQAFPITLQLKPLKWNTNGTFFNPLAPLYYLKYAGVALGSLYGAIMFAAYYAVTISQNRAMASYYHLNSATTGLTFISLGVGNIVGSVLGGKISDIILNRAIKKHGEARPEVRLYSTFFAAICILIGLALNGWFIQNQFHLALVLFAQFLVGMGMNYAFGNVSTFLVDLYPKFGASVTAVANCVRMLGAGIIITVNSIILNNLDYGWTFTMFALIQIPGIAILIFLVVFGKKLRN